LNHPTSPRGALALLALLALTPPLAGSCASRPGTTPADPAETATSTAPPDPELAPLAGGEGLPVPGEEPPLDLAILSASGAPAASSAPAAPPDNRPRIGSIRWYTYIWEKPERPPGTLAMGGIRIGTSVPLRSPDPITGPGCDGRWYAIEPRGYVCTDETTTLNLKDPYFVALASLAPGPGAYPYRYAFSVGTPMYSRIPTPEEQEATERTGYIPKNTFISGGKWAETHEWLVDREGKIEATDELPPFVDGNKPIPGSPWNPVNPKVRVMPHGTGFSYARAFKHSGRVWLLTPDLFFIPADRVFPYKPVTFEGVKLGGEVNLPLAWVRSAGEPRRRRLPDGSFVETEERWGNKAYVPLTGQVEKIGRVTLRQTREAPDLWLADGPGVSVVEQVDSPHFTIGEDEKWIDAHLIPGTMTAYLGKKPLWTTLWSGGKGGAPVPGKNPAFYATTELGLFRFQWKDKVATMSPDKGAPTVQWFADVPHIQYIHAPLALHVAYWHDRFGHLVSAECLNVSPRDAEWLFDFTDPPLPPGWAAVRPGGSSGPSTRIHIKAY
jgi:hypothetical protein